MREELRQHGLQTIHYAANDQTAITAVYYTDGSAEPQGEKAGAAFVCTVNSRDAAAAVVPTATDADTTTTASAARGNVVIATTTAKAVNTTTAVLRFLFHSNRAGSHNKGT